MERESIYIHLNSSNADYIIDGTGNVGFNIPLIETNIQMQILLSIEHVVIPYAWYNINKYNNILNYSISNTSYSLAISPGNYTIKDLVAYLNANLANFTVTYDKIKNKLNFSHATSDFTFLSTSSCFTLLGFQKGMSKSSFSRSLLSPNCVNLIFTPCVCIYSNIDSDCINKSASLQNKRLFHSFPVDVPPNYLLVHSNRELKLNSYTNILSYIELQLCSIDGQILDMNNIHWSITLKLDFVDYVN